MFCRPGRVMEFEEQGMIVGGGGGGEKGFDKSINL